MSDRAELERLWRAGVAAVEGRASVIAALGQASARPERMIAVGKAAGSMALGMYETFGPDIPGLIVTKYDHTPSGLPASCKVIEAAHPIPDDNSLRAGQAVQTVIGKVGAGEHVLCLLSGGASALAEVPRPGLSMMDLRQLSARSIAGGLAIGEINTLRTEQSQIKGGKLFADLPPCDLTVIALSDVEGDALGVIGSGLFDCTSIHVPSHVRARFVMAGSNSVARTRIADLAGDVRVNEETLYTDILVAADGIAATVLGGPTGLYIFGGEPTVMLPQYPGKGGRNQSLAVALSLRLAGSAGVCGLVAGTDGTDGPTDAAGGFTTGDLGNPAAAEAALAWADCYPYLAAAGDLFAPGPTGTNVMDLVLIRKT